jgi:hypothetical protein
LSEICKGQMVYYDYAVGRDGRDQSRCVVLILGDIDNLYHSAKCLIVYDSENPQRQGDYTVIHNLHTAKSANRWHFRKPHRNFRLNLRT